MLRISNIKVLKECFDAVKYFDHLQQCSKKSFSPSNKCFVTKIVTQTFVTILLWIEVITKSSLDFEKFKKTKYLI
jgi:hypothetical protein